MNTANDIRIDSVNAGSIRNLVREGEPVASAIEKRPCHGGAVIHEDGVQTDDVADRRYHGGPDQAVYVYSTEDYAWWSAEMNRELQPGLFGENLTVSGLPSDLAIGDRLICGTLLLEVTGPRIPCHKLGLVMGDPAFPLRFRKAERSGAYCRVLSGGSVRKGDSVALVENPNGPMSVRDMFRLYYRKPSRSEDLRMALATPLASRLRQKFQDRLDRESAR